MYCEVLSGGIWGIEGFPVHVEVNVADGMPVFEMIGCLNREVREAKERVRTALRNSGVSLPARRITVNLAPAEQKKEGAAFDLPVALGIMAALGRLPRESLKDILIVGELSLSGEVSGVKGILSIVMRARELGIRRCLVPRCNAGEGAVIEGVEVVGVGSLETAADYLGGRIRLSPEPYHGVAGEGQGAGTPDFRDIVGQPAARRAAEVAAAGFHNLLMIGPPGSGKTMLARRIPSILPAMSVSESLEVTRIYSAAGLLREGQTVISRRPFVDPHHTVTDRALAGGGAIPRPGAVSLAHRGVLFLDELPEFQRKALEILRQPLEEGSVHISRSQGSCVFPASCLFTAALNPCPCGYYPDRSVCGCTENEVRRYLGRISRPLLDRIDICTVVPAMRAEELLREEEETSALKEDSAAIRARVERAALVQRERYRGTGIRFNSDLKASQIESYCALGKREKRLMEQAIGTGEVSTRAYHRILKVARTIADLDGSSRIREIHLSEAVGYRMPGIEYFGGKRAES